MNGRDIVPLREEEKPNFEVYEDVHILNLIGLGFDDRGQRDYQFFSELDDDHHAEKLLILMYRNMFEYAFICAERKGLDTIYLSDVGGNRFAHFMPRVTHATRRHRETKGDIHLWYYRMVIKCQALKLLGFDVKYPAETQHKETERGNEPTYRPTDQCRWPGITLEHLKELPKALKGMNLEKSLIVNAWDPWSLIGNENFAQPSLDSLIGRKTGMAPLGWALTNPLMKFVDVTGAVSGKKGEKLTEHLKDELPTYNYHFDEEGVFKGIALRGDGVNLFMKVKEVSIASSAVVEIVAPAERGVDPLMKAKDSGSGWLWANLVPAPAAAAWEWLTQTAPDLSGSAQAKQGAADQTQLEDDRYDFKYLMRYDRRFLQWDKNGGGHPVEQKQQVDQLVNDEDYEVAYYRICGRP